MVAEAIGIIFFILSLIILAMGITGYARIKSVPSLLIGIAFGLIGSYDLLKVLGLDMELWALCTLINLAAFVLVMIALYVLMDKKTKTTYR